VSVHLSPGRPKPKKQKGYSEVTQTDIKIMSTSFKIKKCLSREKFWRAMEVDEALQVREIFLGVSPFGVRMMEPASLEPELVIDNLHLVDIVFSPYYGNKLLKIKYMTDNNGKAKPKRKLFYVLPVTAQDIRNYHAQCTTLGEEADLISELPKFRRSKKDSAPKSENSSQTPEDKPRLRSRSLSQKPQKSSRKNSQPLVRGLSEGNIHKPSKRGNGLQEKKVRKERKEPERSREKDKENVEPKQHNQRGQSQAEIMEKRKKLQKRKSAGDLTLLKKRQSAVDLTLQQRESAIDFSLRNDPLVPVSHDSTPNVQVSHRVTRI